MRRREMRIIAFLADPSIVRAILAHLSEPTSPPRLAPARGPPLREMPDTGKDPFDPQAQPAPDYEFDQRIAWKAPRQDDARSPVNGRTV